MNEDQLATRNQKNDEEGNWKGKGQQPSETLIRIRGIRVRVRVRVRVRALFVPSSLRLVVIRSLSRQVLDRTMTDAAALLASLDTGAEASDSSPSLAELRRELHSITHLERSQEELRAALGESPDDADYAEALAENEGVLTRKWQRVAELKQRYEDERKLMV